MSQIIEGGREQGCPRAPEVEAKLDAIARHVAEQSRMLAERARLISVLSTGSSLPAAVGW